MLPKKFRTWKAITVSYTIDYAQYWIHSPGSSSQRLFKIAFCTPSYTSGVIWGCRSDKCRLRINIDCTLGIVHLSVSFGTIKAHGFTWKIFSSEANIMWNKMALRVVLSSTLPSPLRWITRKYDQVVPSLPHNCYFSRGPRSFNPAWQSTQGMRLRTIRRWMQRLCGTLANRFKVGTRPTHHYPLTNTHYNPGLPGPIGRESVFILEDSSPCFQHQWFFECFSTVLSFVDR
jgi:hypothetical protein